MAKLDGRIERIIREQCRQQVDKGMTAIAKVGQQKVLDKRREVTQAWFRGFSFHDMNAATCCTPIKQRTSMTTGSVNLMSFIDVDAYTEKPKAERWKEKYGGDMDARLYVLNLQLYQGIVGLPARATARSDSDWVNPAPHIYEPLIGVLRQNLTSQEFKQEIIKAAGLSTEYKER